MPSEWEDIGTVGGGGGWEDIGTAKPAAAAKPKDDPYSFVNVARGLVEPVASIATGAVATPLAGLAGLAGTALPGPPGQGADWVHQVGSAMTYEPKTKLGKGITHAVSYPFEKLAEGADYLGGKTTDVTGSPALGAGVNTVIQGLPMLLGTKGGKVADARLGRKVEAGEIAAGENAMKDTGRTSFQDAGYITPPEGGIKAGLAGLAGKAKTEKIISEPNELNATRRLSAEVGTPEGAALTPEEFTRLKETTGQAYDRLVESAGPRLDVTNEFKNTVASTLAKVSDTPGSSMAGAKTILQDFWKRVHKEENEPLPGAGGPKIFSTIEKTAADFPAAPAFGLSKTIEQAAGETPGPKGYGSRELAPPPSVPVPTAQVPTLSTTWVKDQISQLRKDAGDDFRRADSNAGTARLGLATQLEELVAANLAKTGEQGLIEAYRAARENFAKIYLLERVTNDATGRVNLQKLASLSDTAKYKGVLTGEFKTAADFAKTFRKAAQKSTGEAVGQPSVFDGMFMVGSIMGGHPWAGAVELGGRYAIPQMAKRGMLQNKSPEYGPGALSRATPDLLRALGFGSPTMGNQFEMPPP